MVAIATLRERIALWEFIDSRYRMCIHAEQYGIATRIVEHTTIYVGMGRSEITQAILEDPENHYTHILYLDNDIMPHEDALVALMAWDVPVVSGLYFMRGPDADPVAYVKGSNPKIMGLYRTVRPEIAQFLNQHQIPALYQPILVGLIGEERPPLLSVDVVGAGFLLVKREVAEQFPDWRSVDRGEDIQWCERVRAAGIPIYLDMGVICAHLGIMPMSTAWFMDSCRRKQMNDEILHSTAHSED